ncbi:hypothetical protein O181_123204 [Austropuccinia psidii MF-1]|uniref:Uncharacterized protein n=1 Tax=Austropuccinia psidii MF-1 TaxID=1389203 RepID=A0A9Q3Q320_9BASI|nr:hypothetical protein [Austropuccinia psidii MF-1]
MPIEHSPPARQTRSQARAQAALTTASRVPLDGTPEVPQLRAQLDRGPRMEGRKRAKQINFIVRSGWRFSRTFKNQSQGSRSR